MEGLYSDISKKVTKGTSDAEIRALIDSHADLDAAKAQIDHEDEINSIFKPDSV